MSDDRVPMSRDGYEKKKAELDRMMNVDMIEIAKRIAQARELGDLSENAEYHASREEQGLIQARIDRLLLAVEKTQKGREARAWQSALLYPFLLPRCTHPSYNIFASRASQAYQPNAPRVLGVWQSQLDCQCGLFSF